MNKLSEKKWYCKHSKEANLEYGNAAKKMILDSMCSVLKNK